jgi:uncharacterized protein YegP (UPF0339 family)
MGRFVISETATGYKFDLRAANGEIIAISEVYKTRAACQKGIDAVIACAPTAPVAEPASMTKLPSNPRFELFSDKSGSFRFRLRAKNGKIIAVSQGYSTASACQNGIESVRENAKDEADNIENG